MVSAAFPGRPFNIRAEGYYTSQSVEGNYSTIYWELWIDKTAYSPTFSGGIANRYYKINGVFVNQVVTNGFDFSSGNNFLLAYGYYDLYHDADGTQDFIVEAAGDFDLLGYAIVGVTIPLPTIPRSSVSSFSGGSTFDPGSSKTINTNRSSGAFTHTIDYYFGSASGVIATGVGASTSWTPPMSLLNQIPNAPSGNGYIRTFTFSGGTFLGYADTPFTLTVPTATIPTWSSVSVSESVSAVTTHVGAGKYVQNVSKPSYTISGAAGVYSSTISLQRFTVAGQTVDGASGTVANPITASGTVVATHTITDSRGRVKTQNTNLTVVPYAAPSITAFQARRALSDGTVSIDSGTYLRVDLTAAVTSIVNTTERNIIQIKVYTRLYGSGAAWTLKATLNPGGLTYNTFTTVTGPFIPETAYEVRVEVLDRFSTSAVQSAISVAQIVMHMGTGIGVGKYWERGALDILGDTYTSGNFYSGTALRLVNNEGTAAQRDAIYGTPANDAARVALANKKVVWFNTDEGWWEEYFAVTGLSGLTALGLVTGAPSGWYPITVGPKISLVANAQVNSATTGSVMTWTAPGTNLSHRVGGTAWFTYASNAITAVKPGRYKVHARVSAQTGSGSGEIGIHRAGTEVLASDTIFLATTYTTWNPQVSNMLLAAGDVINVKAISLGSANVLMGANGTNLESGEFVIEYMGPALVSV